MGPHEGHDAGQWGRRPLRKRLPSKALWRRWVASCRMPEALSCGVSGVARKGARLMKWGFSAEFWCASDVAPWRTGRKIGRMAILHGVGPLSATCGSQRGRKNGGEAERDAA